MTNFNMALLTSWGKRFFDGGDKNWQKMFYFKYGTSKPNIVWAKSWVGSPFWKGLTWALSASRCVYRWKNNW